MLHEGINNALTHGMLRITTVEDGPKTVVHVDGRLDKQGTEALEQLCKRLRGPISLDLSELRSVDDSGIRTLWAMEQNSVILKHVSPYLELLLGRRSGRQ